MAKGERVGLQRNWMNKRISALHHNAQAAVQSGLSLGDDSEALNPYVSSLHAYASRILGSRFGVLSKPNSVLPNPRTSEDTCLKEAL